MIGIVPWVLNLDQPPATPLIILVDPRSVSLVESAAADPFAVDPRRAELAESAAADPFAVDPRRAELVE